MKKYVPCPIDTSKIEIPEELYDLQEEIAKNVHEVWAEARMKEGWTYGKERNNANKTTPCLVSYEEMPESEKEYDRRTAFETIKLILQLGYKIVK